MNGIAKLLTDESKIVFANGDVIEGAVDVSIFILEACKAYSRGYIKGYVGALGGSAIKGAVVGTIVGGTYLVYRNHQNKSKKEEVKGLK